MSSPPKVSTAIPLMSVPPPPPVVPPPAPAPSAPESQPAPATSPEPGVFDASDAEGTVEIADAEVHPLPRPASTPTTSHKPPPPPRRAATLPNAHAANLAKPPPPPSARNAEAARDALTTTLIQGSEAPTSPLASSAPLASSGPASSRPRRGPGPGETSPSGMRRMLDDIDQTFATILTNPGSAAGDGELTADELTEAQRLFRELTAAHLTPVRNFMVELSLSDPSKDWLSMCRPALASLKRAAGDMALGELSQALGALDEVMEQSERTASVVIDARGREALRVAYDRLVTLLPEAFTVRDERDRREPIIVLSLLRQVPDVRKVALDRLAGAGLTSLELFYKAKPADIAEAAGIPRELAERVVARFQRYRREMSSQPPSPKRSREKSALEALARRLEEQNTAFQSSHRSWQRGDETRRLRQERAGTVVDINLVLARLGEVALIERLERLPFQQKPEELRRFLSTQPD